MNCAELPESDGISVRHYRFPLPYKETIRQPQRRCHKRHVSEVKSVKFKHMSASKWTHKGGWCDLYICYYICGCPAWSNCCETWTLPGGKGVVLQIWSRIPKPAREFIRAYLGEIWIKNLEERQAIPANLRIVSYSCHQGSHQIFFNFIANVVNVAVFTLQLPQ